MPSHLASGLFLSFDFGMRHIGYATGQKATCSATAGGTLTARDGIPDWQKVDALIDTWQPEALIVGLPLNMDGSEQQLTHCAKRFGKRLKARYQLDVHFVDERLSTRAARARIFEQEGYQGLTPERVNGAAAQIILERWLGADL